MSDCSRTVFPLTMEVPGSRAAATAILLDKERWIFGTAHHAIKGARTVRVGQPALLALSVVAAKPEDDLALLAPDVNDRLRLMANNNLEFLVVAGGLNGAQAAPIGDKASIGDRVLACGYAFGTTFQSRAVEVVAAGKQDPLAKREGNDFIRLSAAVDLGESGGGLFDRTGQLLGVLVTMADQDKHLTSPGVAIPAAKLRAMLEEWKAADRPPELTR